MSIAGDPKDRRQVLAHACERSEDALGTVFYASSQRTQVDCGARHVVIHPRPRDLSDGTPANGFSTTTYVFPALPTAVPGNDLAASEGRLTAAELATVRGMLADAIGEGTGTAWSARLTDQQAGVHYIRGQRVRSLRGMLVTFATEILERLRGAQPDEDIKFGVVVSRHDVSAHPDAYQTLVPVVANFEALDSDEFVVAAETWITDLAPDAKHALVLAGEAFYLHPSGLRRTAYERVVSHNTMCRIEDALIARWSRDG